jgi:hypothetical protein
MISQGVFIPRKTYSWIPDRRLGGASLSQVRIPGKIFLKAAVRASGCFNVTTRDDFSQVSWKYSKLQLKVNMSDYGRNFPPPLLRGSNKLAVAFYS